MLLPGVGWDVVPTDCLALHVARRVYGPQSINIALQVASSMSLGSALNVSENIGAGLFARMDGLRVATPAAQPRSFDFVDSLELCAPLSFGDLITSWHTTGIPNISMFVHFSGDPVPEGDISMLPEGPDAQQRQAHRARAVAEVTELPMYDPNLCLNCGLPDRSRSDESAFKGRARASANAAGQSDYGVAAALRVPANALLPSQRHKFSASCAAPSTRSSCD